ncbi:hypothetical protein RIF29_32794 [Crotalaria pallida]|uniref:Uncharacterized protein n=1 Tax=Crotalaria pallida TaxID=3830 RepID=A0AAN9HYA8_CROPI
MNALNNDVLVIVKAYNVKYEYDNGLCPCESSAYWPVCSERISRQFWICDLWQQEWNILRRTADENVQRWDFHVGLPSPIRCRAATIFLPLFPHPHPHLSIREGGYVKKRVEVVMPIAIGKEREEIQSKLQVIPDSRTGVELDRQRVEFDDVRYRVQGGFYTIQGSV